MDNIYKISLLSCFFLFGCSSYTPDFMAAYVYACNVERSKNKLEQGNLETFQKRYTQLSESHKTIKKQIQNSKNFSNIEKLIVQGDIEKRFEKFGTFINKAFTDEQEYEKNSAIRDFAAYASLSQPIFNILMYTFASLDDSKAMKVLSVVCNMLKFFEPKVVVEILIVCENFYNKEKISNLNQEFLEIAESINNIMKGAVDGGVLSYTSELDFTPEETLNFVTTLVFLLKNKSFFNVADDDSPSLRTALSYYQNQSQNQVTQQKS